MKQHKIWLVIPAYNEQKYLGSIIKKARSYVKNIVVVDDGSSDKTYEGAEKAGVVVLRHIVNLGKGCTLKTGCDYAISKGADIIVAMDADSQHKPEDIPRFLKSLHGKDIVFGYRSLNKGMPLILRLGNNFINDATKVLYGLGLKDTQCGFRAFTKEAYKKIRWKAKDYVMESEMIANAGKHNLKYSEIPIETIYSDRYKGTTVFDGIKIVWNLIWWKLSKY